MADANTELLIRVRTDLTNALQGLGRLGKELETHVEQARRAGASYDDLTTAQRALDAAFGQARTAEARAQIAALSTEVDRAKERMMATAGSTRTLGAASGNATQALLSLSNGIQDAALAGGDFALMARYSANNVSQMVTQLGYMATAARGAGQTAIGALAGAFTGTGGLIFGVTAAIGLIPPLINWLTRESDAHREAAEAAKEHADAMGDLLETLRTATGAAAGRAVSEALEEADRATAAVERLDARLQHLRARLPDIGLRGDVSPGFASAAEERREVLKEINQLEAQRVGLVAERDRLEIAAAATVSRNADNLATELALLTAQRDELVEMGRDATHVTRQIEALQERMDRLAGTEREPRSRRERRVRTLLDVADDLGVAQAQAQALFDLGVSGPAELAIDRVNALRAAVNEAFGITGGETNAAIEAMVRALVEARTEADYLRTTLPELKVQLRDIGQEPPDFGFDLIRQQLDKGVTPSLRLATTWARELGEAFEAATTEGARQELGAYIILLERAIGEMNKLREEGEKLRGRTLTKDLEDALGGGLGDATFATAEALTAALGEIAGLDFGDVADNFGRAMQRMLHQMAAMIAQALLLRGVLALIGLIPGGQGAAAFLGGALNVAGYGGANATLPPIVASSTASPLVLRGGDLVGAVRTRLAWERANGFGDGTL